MIAPPAIEQHACEAEATARSYELLALAFAPPSFELAPAIERAGGPLRLGPLDPESVVAEFHRLFVGPDHLPAPPYESVHREGWAVMGESTADVIDHYRRAGYSLDPAATDLPDHIGAELAFMAVLAGEEAAAWSDGDRGRASTWIARQRSFLEEHLACWVPELSHRILEATDAPFYRSLAVALREFVALDLERLAGAMERVDAPLPNAGPEPAHSVEAAGARDCRR